MVLVELQCFLEEEANRKKLDIQAETAAKTKAEAEALYAKAQLLMKEAQQTMSAAQKKAKQSADNEKVATKTKSKIIENKLKRMAEASCAGSKRAKTD